MSNYFITLEQPPYLFNYFLAKVLVKKYYFFSCETGTFFKAVPVEKPFFGTVPGCVGLDVDVDGGSSTSS